MPESVSFKRSCGGTRNENDFPQMATLTQAICAYETARKHRVGITLVSAVITGGSHADRATLHRHASNRADRLNSIGIGRYFLRRGSRYCLVVMSADLVQANFKLSTELKQLKSELSSMRARRAIDVAEEVARIKAAYEQIEREVVALRQENLKLRFTDIVEVAIDDQPAGDSVSAGVVSMLSDQLEEERSKYAALEQRYKELRKEFQESATKSVSYSEPSTCVGSPVYRAFVVEHTERVVVKPGMFEPSVAARRTIPAVAEPPRPDKVAPVRPKRKSDDQSIQRLSKIAKFRPNR